MTHATPPPAPASPSFAVIFTSQRTAGDRGYSDTAARMLELAARQPGFLGVDSVRDPSGFGITVSYWASEADIARWQADAEHLRAQQRGREEWYEHFELRIAKVQRARSFRRA